jgi:hypothetical protein
MGKGAKEFDFNKKEINNEIWSRENRSKTTMNTYEFFEEERI